jgi:hypothetical protein
MTESAANRNSKKQLHTFLLSFMAVAALIVLLTVSDFALFSYGVIWFCLTGGIYILPKTVSNWNAIFWGVLLGGIVGGAHALWYHSMRRPCALVSFDVAKCLSQLLMVW